MGDIPLPELLQRGRTMYVQRNPMFSFVMCPRLALDLRGIHLVFRLVKWRVMVRIIEICKHTTCFLLLLNTLRWPLSHLIQVCRNISEVTLLIPLRWTFSPVPCLQADPSLKGERDGCEHPRQAGKEDKRKLLFSKHHPIFNWGAYWTPSS